jgi:hypothetical protein
LTDPRPDALPGPRERSVARAGAAAIFLAVAVIGVYSAFFPTLESRFASIQSDVGDPLLSVYLLEHESLVLHRPGYVGTLWSPPFFFPARRVLAYSESMLGILPFYLLLRPWCSPTLAYQIVVILLLVLCYVAMLALLRSLGARPLLAALGAALFAFGLPREAQIGHLHMLPAFYSPLALLALRRLLASPGRGSLALLLGLLYLQLLSSIHLGWFLFLGLALLVPLWLLYDHAAVRRLAAFCRRRPLFVSLSVIAWLALTYVTFRPYLQAGRELGYRSWETVMPFLPALRTWLTVPAGSLYARLLPTYPLHAPLTWERYLFPGFVFLGLALVAGFHLFLARRGAADEPHDLAADRHLLRACWWAAVVLLLVSLVVPRLAVAGWRVHRAYPGVTLWWYVFRLVPGAKAFRAALRVWTVIYLFGIVAVIGGAEAALRRARLAPWVSGLLMAPLLGLGLLEQHVGDLQSRAKRPFLEQVERIRAQIHPGCAALYATVGQGQPFYVSQLTAMWAGLEANVPTVNGYSSNLPPRYPNPDRTMTPEELGRWAGGPVCVVLVPRAGSALAAPSGYAEASPAPLAAR